MAWTIRPATAADVDALTVAVAAAYAPALARGIALPPVTEGLAEDIRDHLVLVMAQEGDVAGGAIIVIAADHAKLANLAVDPRFGGQGLGRALIDAGEAAARELGLAEMRLVTHRLMPENVALFERFGYGVTERDGNKIYMMKRLR